MLCACLEAIGLPGFKNLESLPFGWLVKLNAWYDAVSGKSKVVFPGQS
ncbi:MAG: hypothetical protein ACXWE9_09945 [Methylobacter sp.]